MTNLLWGAQNYRVPKSSSPSYTSVCNINFPLCCRFKSLHCHLYPKLQFCVDKKQQLLEDKKKRQAEGDDVTKRICECSWKKIICCSVYKDNYNKYVQSRMLERRMKEEGEKAIAGGGKEQR